MKLSVLHRTRYVYSHPVPQSFNEIRMHPLSDAHQTCEEFSLSIHPESPFRRRLDFFSNWIHAFEVGIPHTELLVETRSVVNTHPLPLPPEAARVRLGPIDRSESDDLHEYLISSPHVTVDAEAWRHALDAKGDEDSVIPAALAIAHHLKSGFAYTPSSTTVRSSTPDFFRDRRGVCQDFAHAMIALCRSLAIPARYVSGYLFTGREEPGPTAEEATHAWCDVHIQGFGWIGIDPTHARLAADHHVRLAVGRDYSDVSPFKGSYRGNARARLQVEVAVRAL